MPKHNPFSCQCDECSKLREIANEAFRKAWGDQSLSFSDVTGEALRIAFECVNELDGAETSVERRLSDLERKLDEAERAAERARWAGHSERCIYNRQGVACKCVNP